MWYFSWVLGVSFAVSFSIINAMWLEQKDLDTGERAGAAGENGSAKGG
jgi:cyd operon protein YbgT